MTAYSTAKSSYCTNSAAAHTSARINAYMDTAVVAVSILIALVTVLVI